MTRREEIVQVTDGSGVLEVRGTGLACGLFLRGKPFVLNWSDCAGSVGQEVLHDAGISDEAVAYFKNLTLQGPELGVPLSKQFTALLQQFTSGTYTLVLEEMQGEVGGIDWYGNRSGYYPFDGNLLFTQPTESLHEERIIEYMLQIEAGARPVIVTTDVEGGYCEFILDGHHKLCAYGQLRVPPHRLCITAQAAPRLSLADWPQGDLPRSFFEAISWEARQ